MIRVFSYGGGVQSTAALVLAAQRRIDYKTFLFCNVGADSENPATLDYVERYAKPYAAQHGLDLIELAATRKGHPVTLYGQLTKEGSRSIGIPIRMSNGAPGNRSCTMDFKIRVVDRWLKHKLLSLYDGPRYANKAMQRQEALAQGAIVGLGISLDEIARVKPNMDTDTMSWKSNAWPLLFDVKPALTRQGCMNIIAHAGLPVPPKSSCYFCPFHSLPKWQEMRQDEPKLFEKACDLEALLNERRRMLGRDEVWLTRKLIPLARATTELTQDSLFDEMDTCESGYCMV